jgi:hypothetical protein
MPIKCRRLSGPSRETYDNDRRNEDKIVLKKIGKSFVALVKGA